MEPARAKGREKLWVVRPGDGATVGEIVKRAREEPEAIAEGRVFIGKKRATHADQPVRPGDGVRIAGRTLPGAAGEPEVTILFQERGIVACVKPAGLPTVPDRAGSSHALVALVARAVGVRHEDLRVTSRLDREVSGVVLFALDPEAEDRLRSARAAGAYRRRYVALAHGVLPAEGTWTATIGRAKSPLLRAVDGPEAKEATTHWRAVGEASGTRMLSVEPITGRTHQIRVHASDAGAPLLGDRDYGGQTRLTLANGRTVAPARIALHAARVEVDGLVAIAPIPPELAALWSALGGERDAWTRATAAGMVRP